MIVITGGGTGGHLSIAKALCEVLNQDNERPFYIGSTNGQDKAWFEGYPGFKKALFLPTVGVVNKRGLGKLKSLLNIFKQTFTCIKFFKANNVKKVICVGGYSSAPASFAAVLTRTPLFIHEQNAAIGSLNKILKPFAKEFFSSYKPTFVDYPVQNKFFNIYRVRSEKKCIIFLGGSQGARAINHLAMELYEFLNELDINVIHQCGKNDFEKLKEFYKDKKVDLFAFTDKLHVKLQNADLAIARSGAGSVWELSSCGLPTLFIPYPSAASNHQYFNAKFLEDKNLCKIIEQKSLHVEDVKKWINEVDVKRISTELSSIIKKDGAKKIVKTVKEFS